MIKKNYRPYMPSLITALTVNQSVLSGMTIADTGDGFLVHVVTVTVHTTILTVLVAAFVMSWTTWLRELPKRPTE